jgi:TetR/AcrR family transcriptional repressor of nem operon
MRTADPHAPTKEKLIKAGVKLMLAKGFTATSVDEIIAEARSTKGSFFHFFKSKEDLGKAALERYVRDYQECLRSLMPAKPMDAATRALARIDAAIEVFRDPAAPKSCLLGNFSQELAQTRPEIRALCAQWFTVTNEGLERDLADAGVPRAREVSNLFASVVEGSLILVKAKNDASIAVENLIRIKSYVAALLRARKGKGAAR